MRISFPLLAACLAAAGLVPAGARLWWSVSTRQLRARLAAAGRGLPAVPAQDRAALPLPVQRYLRRAVPRHPRPVAAVRIRHEGEFNLSETGDRWVPFQSSELVRLRPPAFLGDARIRFAPALPVHVRDGYLCNEGFTEARLLALWPLVSIRGPGGIAAAQWMRFLAGSPWYPSLLLPGGGVRWTAVDERRAEAALSDGATQASLLFTFGEDDFVLAVQARARPRLAGGRMAPTPWQGRFWRYAERAGFWIPLEGEVSWILPDGPHPYWRGRITRIEYEFLR